MFVRHSPIIEISAWVAVAKIFKNDLLTYRKIPIYWTMKEGVVAAMLRRTGWGPSIAQPDNDRSMAVIAAMRRSPKGEMHGVRSSGGTSSKNYSPMRQGSVRRWDREQLTFFCVK